MAEHALTHSANGGTKGVSQLLAVGPGQIRLPPSVVGHTIGSTTRHSEGPPSGVGNSSGVRHVSSPPPGSERVPHAGACKLTTKSAAARLSILDRTRPWYA